MLNIIILGAPGSGKGTQSDLLIKHFNLQHISTGDILRTEINQGTELGKIASTYIDNGQLLPDHIIADALANALDKCSPTLGIILDGYPRTLAQAEILTQILNKNNREISTVIELAVDDEELVRRLLERGQISGRTDDNEATIRKRLEIYHTKTAPVSHYYIKENKHHLINGAGTVEEIFDRIKQLCPTS